jgi:hypothetical protein
MLHGKPSGVLPRGAQRSPFFVPHKKIYRTSVRDQIDDAGKRITVFDVHRAVQRYRERVRKGLEKRLKKKYVGRGRVNEVVRRQWGVEKGKVRVEVDKWEKGEEERKAARRKKMEAKKKALAKDAVVPKAKKLGQKYWAGLKMLAQIAPAAPPAATTTAPPAATTTAPPAATTTAPPAATTTAPPAGKKVVGKSASDSDVKPKVVHPNIKRIESKYDNKLNPSQVNGNFKTAIKEKLQDYNKLGTTVPHE